MSQLTSLTFKNLLKKKETLLYFAFALFPMLLLVVNLFDTNFMQLSAPEGSLSFLEFFGAVMSVQHQLTLPLIVLIYLVSTTFYSEIKNGVLFLYKDMSRRKILNAKLFSLVGIYLSYVGIMFLSSFTTYYLYLNKLSYTSGTFFPAQAVDTQSAVLEILGVIFAGVLCVFVATALSLNFSSGLTMLGSVLFILLSTLAPNLKSLRYFFPNGYSNVFEGIGFLPVVAIVFAIFGIYASLMYLYSNRKFKRIEY